MKPIKLVEGETKTLRYRVTESGAPRDLTGLTPKFAAKGIGADDAAVSVAAFEGVVTDALAGEFEIAHTPDNTTEVRFSGRYEVALFDAASAKFVLSAPGGDEIIVKEGII